MRVLQGGPAALRLSSDEAHKLGAVLDAETVHKAAEFEKEWDASSARWAVQFKAMIVGIIPYVQSLIDSLSKAIDTVMVKSKEWEDAWNRLHPKGDGILDTIKKTGMAWIEATGELNKYGASWNAAMRGTDTFSSRFDAAAGSLLSLTGQAQKFLSSSLDIDKTWKSTSDEMADLVATAGKATTTVFPKDPDKGAIAAQMREIDGEIAVLHQGLERKKVIFDAEAKQFAFTQNQKFASLQAATSQEYQAELALLEKEKAIGDLSVVQAEKVNNKIKELKAKHETDMVKLDEQSIAAQMAMWHQYTGAIESAFNSQLRGLPPRWARPPPARPAKPGRRCYRPPPRSHRPQSAASCSREAWRPCMRMRRSYRRGWHNHLPPAWAAAATCMCTLI